MATYGDQIAGMADGTGVPTGLTSRWGGASVTYTVGADSAAPGGKKFNITTTVAVRRLLSLNAADSDGDKATAQVIMLVRQNSSFSGLTRTWVGPIARGSGSAGSEVGHVGAIGRATDVGGVLARNSYASGTGVVEYTSGNLSLSPGVIVWLVLEVSGTSVSVAMYAQNDLFGTPLASNSGTIPGENADNHIGILAFASDCNSDILWWSAGTGVDDAPVPAVPTLTSPTGTQTGSTTADLSVSTDRSNGTAYWVVTTSATKPSVAQIQAGQDHSGVAAAASGNAAVTATGAQNYSATGLTSAITYYAHFQQRDNLDGDSTVATSASFTTAAADVVKGARVTLYSGATPQASITGITAMWWDASPPTGNPVYTTATASTDASGVMELDLDAATSLALTDPGHLMLYKLDGTDEKDSLAWQGRLAIQDIS